MSDLMLLLNFAMDVICMTPPFDEVEAIKLTRDHSMFFSLGAIGLFVVAITFSAIRDVFPGNSIADLGIAICIVAITFLSLEKDTVKGIFLATYLPMVLAFRFGEGVIIGARTSRHLRMWHSLALAGVIVGLYFLLKPLPTETLAVVIGTWGIFGAGLAAFMWTQMMKDAPIFQSPFCIVSLFTVFTSTLVYVSISPFESVLYQCTLPVGLLVGIIGSRVSRQDNGTSGDSSSATE